METYCEDSIRWYVDEKTSSCNTFLYRGSGGNFNNFGTFDDCERHLKLRPYEKLEGCKQQYSSNNPHCSASTNKATKYYYSGQSITDSTGKTKPECLSFQYNGCGGNFNRYDTQQECENYCASDKDIPNDIDCDIPPRINVQIPDVKIIFSPDLGHCLYGAVGTEDYGKRGVFSSLAQCVKLCLKLRNKVPEICKKNQPDVFKKSKSFNIRFYYSQKYDRCIPFETYAGNFDINKNNFPNPTTCAGYCGAENQPKEIKAYNVCDSTNTDEYSFIDAADKTFYRTVGQQISVYRYTTSGCVAINDYYGFEPLPHYFRTIQQCRFVCGCDIKNIGCSRAP